MDENTQKIIKEKFDALPKSIQEIILSSNYQDTLVEIGKENQLNINQMGTLELETTLVMMGLTPTKDFETELTRELEVPAIKSSQMVKEINEKIFLKIRDLLKLMNTPQGEEPSVDEGPELHGLETIPFKVFAPVDRNNIVTIPQPTPTKQNFPTGENLRDASVLKNAGIEIVTPETIRAPLPSDAQGETRTEMLKDVEQPELIGKAPEKTIASVLSATPASKLSDTFKMPTVTTEYSLGNMSKDSTKIPLSVNPTIPKVDPYRLSPDE